MTSENTIQNKGKVLTVNNVFWMQDRYGYCVRCPHCKQLINVSNESNSELFFDKLNNEYNHIDCGGWFKIIAKTYKNIDKVTNLTYNYPKY